MQAAQSEPTESEMAVLAYRALYGWVNKLTGKRTPGLIDEFASWKSSTVNYFRVMIGFVSIIALHFLGVPTEYVGRCVGVLLGWVHG